ncbi:MAG: MBL fold metallo-hydrolase [Firmicutes bacterium]|nr:MBL fold metallo-hydrolase [Bacillota bacterium]
MIGEGEVNIRLTENIMLLGNRHFHFYVVGQKEAAIVECGVSGGVYSLNQQWAGLEKKPVIRHLIASHAHFDHVCGIPALRDLYPGAAVVASSEAQRVLAKAKVVQNFFEQDQQMSAVLQAEGIVPEGLVSPHPEIIAVDRIIAGEEIIDLAGGAQLRAIDAPGHSPCNLAYYLPQDQVMFVSDAGGFQIADDTLFPIFFQGYELYIETLQRLRSFPTRVLAIPHERIWRNEEIPAFYDRAIEAARTAYAHIESMLEGGWEDEDIKRNLFAQYYQGDLRIYSAANINICVELLMRRVKECL